MATIGGRQVRDVAAERLRKLRESTAMPSVTRMTPAKPSREAISARDMQQVINRQSVENSEEGNVRRGKRRGSAY